MVTSIKKIFLAFLLGVGVSYSSIGQNFQELSATDAVTGKSMNLPDMVNGKGLVLIFHSLNCPFAKMYESRIIALRSKFQSQGIAFALINPETGNSDTEQLPLKNHIDQSGLNMSYLIDAGQAWTKLFQITKIPEAVVLIHGENGLSIAYRGAIDNNAQAESAVSERHLERAINQILKGESPTPAQVRAVGCNIRTY
jgi:hypothetical protein